MKPLTALAIARALENKLGVYIWLETNKAMYSWCYADHVFSVFKTTDIDAKKVAQEALAHLKPPDKKPKRKTVYDD